jgi:hypothetical protein
MRCVTVEIRGGEFRVAFRDKSTHAMAVTRLKPGKYPKAIAISSTQARAAISAAHKEISGVKA